MKDVYIARAFSRKRLPALLIAESYSEIVNFEKSSHFESAPEATDAVLRLE